MQSSKLLSRHPDSAPFDEHFDIRRVIGKMVFLGKSTHPDIELAIHQCTRVVADPKVEHGKAIKWIGLPSPKNMKQFDWIASMP